MKHWDNMTPEERKAHALDSLRRDYSWVIVRREDNQPIFETHNESLIPLVNTEKYKVFGIREWLGMLNYKSPRSTTSHPN